MSRERLGKECYKPRSAVTALKRRCASEPDAVILRAFTCPLPTLTIGEVVPDETGKTFDGKGRVSYACHRIPTTYP